MGPTFIQKTNYTNGKLKENVEPSLSHWISILESIYMGGKMIVVTVKIVKLPLQL